MAKKAKKKAAAAARNLQKEKRFPTSFPKSASQEIVSATTDTVVDGDSVVKETPACPHLEKGLNLEKFSLRVSSLESLKCHDCREVVAERKSKKGKNKQGTNKGIGLNSKSESMTKWVCLECGCFSCGGLGLPTTPQSHAARHAKQYRHPLVLQFGNPNLRWCFPCNTLIPVQKSEEDGELKDTLSEFVKVLKTRSHSSFQTRADVEGIWFGRGSVLGSVKSVNVLPTLQTSDNTGYSVRGLVNLGNTCFFNSVLQNLLAMDKLRDYFLKLEGTVGPLAASLKKLFAENIPSTGAKNVINPRAFFACVCAKAPQFRGFQQHDSHELLRCLLDGLSTEESRIQKRLQNGNTIPGDVNASPTFVDTIFGGQISSTVSCLECGHTSVVSEPYLDLSLPLPTKRSPSKKNLPVSRSKKPKLPPKRQGKFRPKTKKLSSDAQSVTNTSISDESGPAKSIETCCKQNGTSSSSLTQSESVVIDAVGNTNDAAVQNGIEQIRDSTVISSDKDIVVSNGQDSTVISPDKDIVVSNGQDSTVISSDKDIVVSNGHDTTTHLTGSEMLVQVDFRDSEETPSWLDFLEASTSTVNDMTPDNQDLSVTQDYGNSNDVVCEDEPQLIVQESEVILLPYEEFTSSNGGNEVILSSVTSEKEPSDFDGFGGLFDEPELDVGPTEIPLSNGVEESESDPEEVDDNDSPVSVEKCLAYFTTPELLTKTEHAWQCEQCSKSLLSQKTKLKNQLQIPVSNGGENGISTASSDSGVDHLLSNGVGNANEQITENADMVLVNGNSENSQDTESCSVNGPTENSKNENGQHESDSSESEEVDSKSVKVARDATKRILISRAPRVLTIHLKRFCQDARGHLSKLNGHVNFRDTVDLKPYMDPSCCKDKETYTYSLVGVVEHSGSMRGGHYVAYVKGGAKDNADTCSWYHASDAYVREVSLEEVLRCEAYILFYEEM